MKHNLISVASLILTTIVSSCKKDNNSIADCFPNDATVRQITNVKAAIKLAGAHFYIVQQNTIDSKLNPCNLTQDFQVDNLQVTISGDVKLTLQGGPAPCCIENFVITKITR